MKKHYKRLLTFLVLVNLFAINLLGQISGIVTINAIAPTGGTNYQTFNALATALTTSGINGPLTVNVVANTGPYNEQVVFTQCTGMGSANPIIINGNGNTLTFNSTNSAQPWTLGLNGADFMTVNNLNVVGQGTSYALVCILSNGANNNSFNNCSFTAPLNGTSSTQAPFSLSASMTSLASGIAGNYNTVTTCTMSNGYYGIYMYSSTSAPFQTNNSIIGCWITDFYYAGIYYPYNKYCTIKGNVLDRLTRTSNSGTVYGLAGWYQQGAMIDGNKVYKLYESQQGQTSGYTYAIYTYYCSQSGGIRNTVRNNILTDIKSNYYIYGLYAYYMNGDIYNNTIDLDWAGAGANSGAIYGLTPYGGAGYNNNCTNNIVTINRGTSTATKYGMYFAGTAGNVFCDRNVVNISGSTGGTNYWGYYTAASTTWAGYIAQGTSIGLDATSFTVNPAYNNQTAGDLHPTNPAINDQAIPMGLTFDQQNAVRNQSTPDIGALEFLTPLCTGTPTMGSVASPTYALCPGEVTTLGLTSLNPLAGITYSWVGSQTSAVGPFTLQIPGNTTSPFVSTNPLASNTWYSVVVTCTNPGGGGTSSVGQIQIAGSTTTVVPYNESFEGIGANNRLPNCSWSSNSLGSAALTSTAAASGNRIARTGSSFAYFDNTVTGTNYFYTNSITMKSGITYSAALWYATEYLGNTNWTSLSILVGPNQNPTGMVQVATISPAASGAYKSLSNVFTVPSTGLYYVAIKAVSSAGAAQYLSWDDLSITIPCNGLGAVNAPTVTVAASSPSVCSNQLVSLTASGAGSYSWTNNGATTSGITDFPFILGINNYTVIGTNLLTGCSNTVVTPIYVNDSPWLLVSVNPPTVCAGQPVVLSALGNSSSYQWSTGGNVAAITVTTNAPATYTVIGTGANGCVSTFAQAVAVSALPVVTANSSIPDACKEDVITLTALGATTYQWISNTSGNVLQGSSVNVTLSASTVFTVTGTNSATGCSAKNTVAQNINDCTGINKYTSTSSVKVYPNPTSGEFTIEFNSASLKTIEVMDLTGRIVQSNTSADQHVLVNLNAVANGIYYVKVISTDNVDVIKVVKQ